MLNIFVSISNSVSQMLLFILYSFLITGGTLAFLLISKFSEFFSEGPTKLNYDFIIVGTGTGGSTILSDIPSDNVLIIEAGPMTSALHDIPFLTPILQETYYDWSYETAPQENACRSLNGQKSKWSMGRGYGGSNILNNMIYNEGHPEDYRGWFSNSEDYDFSEDIELLFRMNRFDLKLGPFSYKSAFWGHLNDGIKEITNTGIIFEKAQVTMHSGWRWSMPHFVYTSIGNSGHHLLTDTTVTKILFDPNDKYRAIGVEIDGKRQIFAKNGVILSAGTIGTPKILMHSGIGPCEHLADFNIPCLANLTGVGENLQDHISTGIDLIHLNISLGYRPIDLLTPMNIWRYLRDNGDSPLATVGCEAIGVLKPNGANQLPVLGFMAMPMGLTVDNGVKLRHNLNINDLTWNNYFRDLVTGIRASSGQTVSILAILLHPESRGSIKLASGNFQTPPIIDPNYLSHKGDIDVLKRGIDTIKSIIRTESMQKIGAKIVAKSLPGCEQETFDSDAYWECYIRHLTLTVYHPVGTCRMGDLEDPRTVVGKDFRVKGFQQLYIVDASVMPNLSSGNPNAAIAMIGRRFLQVLNEKPNDNKKK